MKHVLITGATGFVGRGAIRRFVAAGAQVRALVHRESAQNDEQPDAGVLFEEAQTVPGTLSDPNSLAQAMQGCDLVVHAAALTRDDAPIDALQWTNVAGSENVLKAAQHAGVSRVLYISCADVTLSKTPRIHWDEKRRLAGIPFGHLPQSKQLAEDILLTQSTGACEVVALRPAYLWGRVDSEMRPRLSKLERSSGICLFGQGSHFFSAAHVDVVADAILTLATSAGVGGRAFQVADADIRTTHEFFSMMSAAMGLPAPRFTYSSTGMCTDMDGRRCGTSHSAYTVG